MLTSIKNYYDTIGEVQVSRFKRNLVHEIQAHLVNFDHAQYMHIDPSLQLA